MKWQNFFKPVGSIDSQTLRDHMASHGEETYTLLDVRQPREYEDGRIPGATLIPLPQLPDRLEELDTEKPILVYCAVGGRSRAAAQLLAGRGFKKVYNLKGGIKAWNGLTAKGPLHFGNEISHVKEMDPVAVVVFARGMEKGLADFYRLAANKSTDKGVSELLTRLAGVEIKHQEKLLEVVRRLAPEKEEAPQGQSPSLMEGGVDPDDFMQKNAGAMETTEDVLSLAMMLETQSLDLYLRLANFVDHKKSRSLLLEIADDEKAHLAALGEMIETERLK